jgi:glycosyltransferase EpsH
VDAKYAASYGLAGIYGWQRGCDPKAENYSPVYWDVHLVAIAEIWFSTLKDVCSLKCNERLSTLPKVSVVVPVFNAKYSIEECASSIINQTFSDFEIVFVNDGSTDNSAFILERLRLADDRVKVFHQENKGTGEARNTGIRNAKGEFICFLDSDDTAEPQMLSDLFSNASEGVDIVVCDFNEVSENGEIRQHRYTGTANFSGYFNAILSLRTASSVWAKLYRKTLFDNEACLFPLNLRNNEDNATLFKLLFFGRNILFVPKALYNWKRRLDSKSRSINALRLKETISVLCMRKKFLQEQGLFEDYLQEFYSGVIYTLTLRKSHIVKFAQPHKQNEYMQSLHTDVLQSRLIDKSELTLLRSINPFDYWRFVFLSLDKISETSSVGYQIYFESSDWDYALKCVQGNGMPEIHSLNHHLEPFANQSVYIYGIGQSWQDLQSVTSYELSIQGFIDQSFKEKKVEHKHDIDTALHLIQPHTVIVIASVDQAQNIVTQLKKNPLYKKKQPILITFAGVFVD